MVSPEHPDNDYTHHIVTAAEETAAVGAGHGPMYEDIRDEVKDVSELATRGVRQAQEVHRERERNLRYVSDFADLLPPFSYDEKGRTGRTFAISVEAGDAYYTARQLQASVLWIAHKEKETGWLAVAPERYPYFVIGRKPATDFRNQIVDNATELLLLAAASNTEEKAEARIRTTVLHKDDLVALETIAKTALTDDGGGVSSFRPDGETGTLCLSQHSTGNLLVNTECRRVRYKPKLKKVLEEGVPSIKKISSGVDAYLSSEFLKSFQMDTEIAKLASAFGIVDDLQRLVEQRDNPTHKTVKEIEASSKEAKLEAQNKELRHAMVEMLTPLLGSRDVAETAVDKRFPHI